MSVVAPPPTPSVSARPDEDPLVAALADPSIHQKLLTYARVLVRRSGDQRLDVEEIVQNAKVRALEIRDRFDPNRGQPGAWLSKILLHVFQEEYRKVRGLPRQAPVGSFHWEQLTPCRPAADQDLADCRFLAERYLSRLKDIDRAIVKLSFFEDRSHHEIAALLRMSYDNVRARFSRAIRAMMELASAEGHQQEGRS